MRNASHDPLHYAASFAFIAWPHPALPGHYWPALVPGWTLNYEMFFYLLVGAALLLPRRFRVSAIAAALIVAVLIGFIGHSGILSFYTNPILLEFLLGLLIGLAFDPRQPTRASHYVVCLAGIALFAWTGRHEDEGNRLLTWGLPLALAAFGAINISLPRANVLVRTLSTLGDASYSIYLSQFIVLPAAALVMARLLPALQGPIAATCFVVGVIGIAVLAGVATYYLVEKPMLRASTGLLARNQRSAARPTVAQW
jgi:exopolysaccharide production protein ExoZ